MKKVFFALTFSVAMITAFAFKTTTFDSAFGDTGSDCLAGTLNQAGCGDSGTTQCTVTVGSQILPAYRTDNGTACANQLKFN